MKQIIHTLLRCRPVILPALSAAGAAFFIFAKYSQYPTIEVLTLFVWMYSALFYIAKYGNVKIEKDDKGNLSITKKNNENEDNDENGD